MNIELNKNVVITKDNIRFRVLGEYEENIIAIQLDTSKRVIVSLGSCVEVLECIADGRWECVKDMYPEFVPREMSEEIANDYSRNQKIIAEVNAAYGHQCYIGLSGMNNKPMLTEISKQYVISKSSLSRLILRYLQSGCCNTSLIDKRCYGFSKEPKQYEYIPGRRPGRRSSSDITSEVILNSYVRGLFDAVINHRLATKHGSFRRSFDIIIQEAYGVKLDENGSVSFEEARRVPTIEQFYQYKKKYVTKKSLYCATHSETEHRNNHRPLLGDTTIDALGIGDSTQVDIVDADLFLRGRIENGVIGRPHIYLLRDVATRVILAYAICLKNNSIYGLISLLVNLAADKVALAAKYGVEMEKWQWPSNILPGSIYCDNGSDFKSQKIEEIYLRLGIERNLEPPSVGSMKGLVEGGFASFNDFYKQSFEDVGVILKRYDSAHKDNAKLILDCVHEMVIRYIKYHNCHSISIYPLTKDMVDNNIMPRPVELWNYFSEHYPYRKIMNNTEFLFDCMFEGTASVTRRGIMFKGLSYLPDSRDKEFVLDMDNHVTSKTIPIRYSYLDDSFILYFRKAHCYAGRLNDGKTAEKSLTGLDFGVIEDYKNARRKQNRIGEIINMVLRADSAEALERIRKAAQSNPKASTEKIRENRQKEQEVYKIESSPYTNLDEFGKPVVVKEEKENSNTETQTTHNNEEERDTLKSIGWEEAMEDFML